jgi:hypothetical protein
MRKQFHKLVFFAATLTTFGVSATSAAVASLIDFTVALDNNHDAGLFYTTGSGATEQFTVGLEVSISAVDEEPTLLGPIAAFCAEIEETIFADQNLTFSTAYLRNLAAGTAGQPGTASAGMPSNGIGSTAAAQLSYLFDQHYISSLLTDWTMTDANPTLHAFQLAIWEVTHDSDLNLSSNTGSFFLNAQTGGTNPTRRQNAVSLAQAYLDDIAASAIGATYTSNRFDILALVSDSGNGDEGFQDIVLAFEKDSPEGETFLSTATVPEPSSSALCFALIAGSIAGLRRRATRG